MDRASTASAAFGGHPASASAMAAAAAASVGRVEEPIMVNDHRPSAEQDRTGERIAKGAEPGYLLRLHVIDVFGGVVFLLKQSGVAVVGFLVAFVQAATNCRVRIPVHASGRALIAVEAMERQRGDRAVLLRRLDRDPIETRR